MRMTRLTQRRQILQWRQEDVRNTRNMLVDFRSTHTDATLGARSINNPTNWNTMRAGVTAGNNVGNPGGITVTTTSQARADDWSIEVIQTARAQFTIGDANAVAGLQGVADALPGNRTIMSLTLAELGMTGTNTIEFTHGTGAATTTSEVTLTGNMTLNEVLDAINRNGGGVNVRFDNLRGAFTLEGIRTGAENAFELTGDSARLFMRLGLTDATYTPGVGLQPGTTVTLPLVAQYEVGNPPLHFYRYENGNHYQIPNTDLGDFELYERYMPVSDDPADGFVRAYLPPNPPTMYVPGPPNPGSFVGDPLVLDMTRGNAAQDALVRISDSRGQINGDARVATDAVNAAGDTVYITGLFASSTNTLTQIEGLSINIAGATGMARNAAGVILADATNAGQQVNINVHRNVDDAIEMIREFVEAYNEMIRNLNTLHTTARPRAGGSARGSFFEPLTDEQRAAMSDREVERWEEQARIGLLHRDNDIRNIQQQLRDAMMSPVVLARDPVTGNVTDQIFLFNVGITTVGMDGASEDRLIGVLQIDEERLRSELEADPDRVMQLFAQSPIAAQDVPTSGINTLESGSIIQRNARSPYVGIGWRLNDLINNVAIDFDSSLRQRAGVPNAIDATENTLSRQIRDYDRRIDQMQEWLIRRENHFFAMFARMEQAMAQSHQQMDALFAFAMQ